MSAQDGPAFILIGVQKAGTTSTITALNAHPRVSMLQNEIHFFDNNALYERGITWYKSLFADINAAGLVSGEKTPAYCYLRHAVDRIHTNFPHTKLILILREPVQRAHSEWCMYLSWGKNDAMLTLGPTWRTSMEALRDTKLSEITANGYWALQRGFYDEIIEYIWSKFNKNQVHIAIAERVLANPTAEYNRIFDFLGVENMENVPVDFSANRGKNKTSLSNSDISWAHNLYRDHNERLYRMLGERIEEWETYYKENE